MWSKLQDASWRFFVSLKLTFVLLFFIGLGAVIGMSYDQTLSFEEFQKNIQASSAGFGGTIANFFELYDVFHSWWFSFSVLLLAANLIACSIERLPRIFFDAIRPRPYLTDRRLLGLSLKETLLVPDIKSAQRVVEGFFQAPLLHVQLKKTAFFFNERSLFGRFGVYVVHIALLNIMFSSIYATQKGVDGHVMIEEGKSSRFITAKGAGGVNYTYDLGFYVGCRDFRLRTFVDNSPMEFESDLFIEDEHLSEKIEKTVRVNEPLSYAGFTFYQSNFRPVISEKIVEIAIVGRKDGYRDQRRVHLNTEIKLPNGDVVIPKKLFEDFAGLGQALRMHRTDSQGHSTYFHVFRKYPEYDGEIRGDDFSIQFLDSDQQYATGLSVGNVPGISVIFFGFILLMLGLAMCFFTTPQRRFARIDEEAESIKVILAAQGFRNLSSVKDDFLTRVASARALFTEKNNA